MGRTAVVDGFDTFIDVVRARAQATPDREAFTFLADGELDATRWDYRTLDTRARAVAVGLKHAGGKPGDRALLLYPPGAEFIAGFIGCLYAGMVAVPAYPPRSAEHERALPRLQGILNDARPSVILSSSRHLYGVRECVSAAWSGDAGVPHALDTEILLDASAAEWRHPMGITPDTVAMLQYTSGSTAAPKGVVITHANLLRNAAAIRDAFGTTRDSRGVSWLPPYHDMGLIGGILQPIFAGARTVLMPPAAFLQKPLRWLKAIAQHKATISGGPDFAYDLCVRSIRPQDRAGLDLSAWDLAFTGAEPVRRATLDRFAEAFAPHGFRAKAFYPCYGMAEATLLVSGGPKGAGAASVRLDAAALRQNKVAATRDAGGAADVVQCGTPVGGTDVKIIDPQTAAPCAADAIGEIWVNGGGVARGYWNNPTETASSFGAKPAAAAPADDGRGWLRTGDLGFLTAAGQLCVTGRIKDLIIVRGRNHYPQDLEHTAGGAHPAVRPTGAAAFAVDVAGREQPALLLELERTHRDTNPDGVFDAVREAVSRGHELQVHAIVLLKPGRLPRTSSGKVRRHACRDAYLKNEDLGEVARWTAPPPAGDGPDDGTAGAAGSARAAPGAANTALNTAASPAGGRSNVRASVGTFPTDAAGLERWLLAKLAAALKVAVNELDAAEPFARYGLDSATAVAMAGEIATELDVDLEASLFWDYPTVRALAAHLADAAGPGASPARPAA